MGSPLVVEPPQEVAGAGSPAPTRRPPRRWVLAAVVAVVLLAVAVFALTRGPDTAPITASDVNKAVQNGIAKAQEDAAKAPPDAAAAYRVALPSLVTIATQRTGSNGAERGTGAGVVVSADGTILTALHVVDGATTHQGDLRRRHRVAARAIAGPGQPDNDIAVLTPSGSPRSSSPRSSAAGRRSATPVFALGHPLGLTGSLSAGVVSALDRTIKVSTGQTLKDLIQFDAAVNPGNSGGPLLNKAGQVVGIVTGLANPSEQTFFVGIGFAVPIATAGGVAGSPPQ